MNPKGSRFRDAYLWAALLLGLMKPYAVPAIGGNVMSDSGQRPLGSQYRLESLIGRGGMGEVWRGVDAKGDAYAFKLLLPQFAEDTDVIRRFVAERHLLTSIDHPNVVGVHDLVIEGSTLAIVMELVEGTDLRHHLDEQGTLAPEEACRLASQLAAGLGAIHAKKIVHRDVKPGNTLLDQSDDPMRVRLTDFGVSRLMDEADSSQQMTAMAGTPRYMAPEVINGDMPSPRSDIYSLGVVLFEMLVGLTPFAGMATGPMMQAHLRLDPGRPDGIDDRIWQLIMQLVNKDPAQRPSDASALAGRLSQLAHLVAGQPALEKLTSAPAPVPSNSMLYTHIAGEAGVTQLAAPSVPPGWAHMSASAGTPPPSGSPYYPPGMASSPHSPSWSPSPSYHPVPGQHTPTPQPVVYGATQLAPKRNRTPALVAIIGLLVVTLVVLVAVAVLQMTRNPDVGAAGSDESSDQTTAPVEPTNSPQTEPTDVVTVTAPPTTATTTQPPPAPFPPAGATLCPGSSTVAVNEVTSCEFAGNVTEEFRLHGLGVVTAYSPVTGIWYDMTCSQMGVQVVQCTGGNNAAVYIRES